MKSYIYIYKEKDKKQIIIISERILIQVRHMV